MSVCEIVTRGIILLVFMLSGCTCFLMDTYTSCMTRDLEMCSCTTEWSLLTVKCSGRPISGMLRSNGYFNKNNHSVYDNIILSNNYITSIDVNTFSGLEDDIYHLDLSGNNLPYLPHALTRLSRLSTLDLSQNPLTSLNPAIMSTLGMSLKSLYIGLRNFGTWPYEMDKLNKLEKLTLHELQLNVIPTNAFDSFKHSLTVLNITTSMLTNIPSAICNISYFQTLSFFENKRLGINNDHIFEPCQGNRSHVKFMLISGSKIEKLPVMHKTVASVDNIGIINANLQFVNHDDLISDTITRGIDLRGNDLVRIPFALNKVFPMIRYLDVSGNYIRTVDELDVYNLAHLNSLNLNNNPLRYIARDAFRYNPYLSSLELSNTQLGHIPSAVMTLDSLYVFKIEQSGVVCDCNMDYLKSWNVTSVTLAGTCTSNNMPIKAYINQILPTC